VSEFAERVYALVRNVPPGKVISYGAVARLLGAPHKSREVGWAMHSCPDDVPAHRVVNRNGEVSGDAVADGAALRRSLLEDEGVVFDSAGRCDMSRFAWESPPQE
jgi:methylated-DNA-protein-cysteine methyltransferase related protein